MELLLDLYLGHLLGDFVLQPGWLVAAKRRGLPGLLLHTGIIGVCTAVVLYAHLTEIWNVVLLAMAAHLAIEILTIRLRGWTRVSGLSVFLVDQALHIASLVALVWLASPWQDIERISTFGIDISSSVTALVCGLVGVTFMGSILIFEVGNALGPESMRAVILPFDIPRVLGMLERAAALLLAVFVHPLLVIVPFIPRTFIALRSPAEERARQMLVASVGLLTCVAAWALIAAVALRSHIVG